MALRSGAEVIDRVGDLERRSRSRAFLEHGGRQARHAVLAGRIVGGAAEHDEVDLRDRHFVQLDDPDRQAVGELPLLDRGQLERRRRPHGGRLAAVGRLCTDGGHGEHNGSAM